MLIAALAVAALPFASPARAAGGSAGCASVPPAGTATVSAGGRQTIVHAPADSGRTPLPLVLNLHAYTSDAGSEEAVTGMDGAADAGPFVVAYPQGTAGSNGQRGWNVLSAGGPAPTDEPATLDGLTWGADDAAFLGALVPALESAYCIDPARVHATGYSMGGILALALACNPPAWLASVSAVAATPPSGTACARVPALVFHGEQDTVDRYAGNGAGPPLPTALGCGATVWASGDVVEQSCAAGPLYSVSDGGHTWPGGPDAFLLWLLGLGNTTYAVNASQLIGQFAASHPR